MELVKSAFDHYGSKNLCIAGGVGLNMTTNSYLLNSPFVDEIFIQPAAGDGGFEIGRYSLIGHHSVIMTYNRLYEDVSIPIRFQDLELKKVKSGEGVWLGAHVVVLSGVTIGDGSVVGAGAVVTKDIPPYSIAVGVPAKVIRKRE